MISMRSGISKYYLLLLLFSATAAFSQTDSARYDRPSLCIMMMGRQEMAYSNEIEDVFRMMEMPERFNDHGLGVRVFKVSQDGKSAVEATRSFVRQTELAKKMVSKWFLRNKEKGCFDISLLQERGLYNTTIPDVKQAMQTIRGKALLADAGEKLIGHTFLVVNEYKYEKHFANTKEESRKEMRSQIDLSKQEDVDAFNEMAHGGELLRDISITCSSHLFQLVWDEEAAAIFYNNYYYSCDTIDTEKRKAFGEDRETFKLEYLGSYSDKIHEKNSQQLNTSKLVKKACVRITDKNLAQLQHLYPQFRIKAALVSTQPLKAYIGLKEDVSPKSQFEVLEPVLRADGTYTYRRQGIIKPIEGKIWDNRYMATDEQNGELNATWFEQISGGELSPGLVIREL